LGGRCGEDCVLIGRIFNYNARRLRNTKTLFPSSCNFAFVPFQSSKSFCSSKCGNLTFFERLRKYPFQNQTFGMSRQRSAPLTRIPLYVISGTALFTKMSMRLDILTTIGRKRIVIFLKVNPNPNPRLTAISLLCDSTQRSLPTARHI
jgi:predicted nucleic acid-binding Zn ribbon protein